MLLSTLKVQDLLIYLHIINNRLLMLLGPTKGVDEVSNHPNANKCQEDGSPVHHLVSDTTLDVDQGAIRNLQ